MEENQLDEVTQEIIACCQHIFENINFGYELENLQILYQDLIYIEIFKVMFPFLEVYIQDIENNVHSDPSVRLQQLIDLLSSDILTMDLSHIKGEAIYQEDNKHLLNFLQIIFELSKLYKVRNKDQENEEDIQVRSTPITPKNHISNLKEEQEDRSHSDAGINQKIINNDNAYPNDQLGQISSGKQSKQQTTGKKSNQGGPQQQPMNQNYMEEQQDQQEMIEGGREEEDDQNQVQGFYDDNGEFHEVQIDAEGNLIDMKTGNVLQLNEEEEEDQDEEDQEGMQQQQEELGEQINYQNEQQVQQQFNVIQEGKQSEEYQESQDQESNQIDQQNQIKQQQEQQVYNEEEDTEEDNQYPKTKSLPRQKSKKELVQEQNQYMISPEEQKQLIENEMFPIQQQSKVLVPNMPSKKGKKKKKGTKKVKLPPNYQQQQYDQQQQQENQDDIFLQLSEEQKQVLEQLLVENGGELPMDNPIVMQYLQQLQLQQMQESQQPEGYVDLNNLNMKEIISEQIKNVKEGLGNMRNEYIPEDDKQTTEQFIRQKNQYKNFLNQHLKDFHLKERMKSQKRQVQDKNLNKKLIRIKVEKDSLQKQYLKEKQYMQEKLRDDKINYLRKIHRIIFELEKRKIIEEKKEHRESRKKRNEDTRNIIYSLENSYKERTQLLKENLQNKRQERKTAEVAQRQFVSRVEKELRNEKKKQIDELKDLWRQEKQRFDMLMKDDVILEQQIMELYKKY